MDSSNHSICHEAGLNGLKAPVAHGVEEKEGLLADPGAIVVEDGKRSASLLLTECLRREAASHHLTHDHQIQLVMGQVSHLTAY